MKGKIPRQEWSGYVQSFRTPGRLQSLEAMTKVTEDQFTALSMAGVKQLIGGRKLGDYVDTRLSKSDPQFAHDLQTVQAGLPLDPRQSRQPFDDAQKYLAAKRHDFRLSAYKPYVKVIDPAFQDQL